MLYNSIPKMMVRYGEKDVVKWIKKDLSKGRVSKTCIPRATLTGKPVDYTKYFKMIFGGYGQEILSLLTWPP